MPTVFGCHRKIKLKLTRDSVVEMVDYLTKLTVAREARGVADTDGTAAVLAQAMASPDDDAASGGGGDGDGDGASGDADAAIDAALQALERNDVEPEIVRGLFQQGSLSKSRIWRPVRGRPAVSPISTKMGSIPSRSVTPASRRTSSHGRRRSIHSACG